MSAMVRVCSWVERWNVLFNESESGWTGHSVFQRMNIFAPLHKWKTFIICFIYCPSRSLSFWLEDTKRRPTISNCEITPVSFGSACLTLCVLYSYFWDMQLPNASMCLVVTLLRYQRHAQAVMFFAQRAIVLFGWNKNCTLSGVVCNSTFIC